MLDNVFFKDMISRMDMENQVLFESFIYVKPKQTLIQLNRYDCGVFAIRNIQQYGENWATKVIQIYMNDIIRALHMATHG